MFTGCYQRKMDRGGRIYLPKPYLRNIGGDTLYVALFAGLSVAVFPSIAYSKLEEKVSVSKIR